MILRLELPWPPSVNSYWRRKGHMYFISKAGQEFRREVDRIVREQGANYGTTHRLSVDVLASPPDRRTRDLDNILKSLFDALKHADVYEDDGQIDRLCVVREPNFHGGVVVTLQTLEGT